MFLGLLHHGAEPFPVKQRRCLPQQTPAGLRLSLACLQKIFKLPQFQHRFVVSDLHVLQGHVDNQDDFLTEIVKGNDFVKEHQIRVLEAFRVLGAGAHCGFAVSQVIVGKIPYQPAGEGGQIVKAGAFVIRQDLPQAGGGILCLKGEISHPHLTVFTSDGQFGVKAEKGIAPPFLILMGGFQQIAVGRYIF